MTAHHWRHEADTRETGNNVLVDRPDARQTQDSEGDRGRRDSGPKTWNPNENSVLPFFPPNTRLSIRPISQWKQVVGFVCVLLIFAAIGVGVWQFITYVR